ncbi:MAG: SigE family RNA polymerase sigma factor [Williamsia herbipolensis]|nr:SigE family RNA polymerase sigma factor [Williamsia herbipolensis]
MLSGSARRSDTRRATEFAEFAEFARTHTSSLYGTARLLTGSRQAAEDLLQDVFVTVYPRWDRVRAADNPVAYVRRAVVNAFISSTRRSAGRESSVDPAMVASLVPSSHDHADAVVAAGTVGPALATLSDRQRAAVVLRYFHSCTDVEIAEALGCRRGTARSLVSRGLELLRRSLTAPEVADRPTREDHR